MCLQGGAQRRSKTASGDVAAKAGRVAANSPLAREIGALLAEPAVARAHWGVMVTGMDGAPIYGVNEGQLFQPASNAKLFTTSAAMALLGGSTTFETRVVAKGVMSGVGSLAGDLVLVGGGDANLSGRTIPYVAPAMRPKAVAGGAPLEKPDALRYLAAMADQVAATGLKVVNGDVVGDDTLFPWEPYAEDWVIDDTVWGFGAPVSALTVNDNQVVVTAGPGTVVGSAGVVTVDPVVPGYYVVDASGLVTDAAKSGSHVQMERALGGKVLRVYGSIAVDAAPDVEEVAIHDPAEYAAMALKGMLESRGLVVTGVARARHRLPTDADGFITGLKRSGTEDEFVRTGIQRGSCLMTPPLEGREHILASHQSPALVDDVTVTNKVSQNLHAELLLHDLGRRSYCGKGSTVEGARLVRAFLTVKVGIDPEDFVFYDGSGLSGHDLVTPRATVRLLQYAARDPKTGTAQPWFADWKKSLPVGGEDGSLIARFGKTPLKDHVFAKTGTLGEARALSGYLECASGRTVIFSIMVGNHTPGSNADREAMDKIVGAIAARN